MPYTKDDLLNELLAELKVREIAWKGIKQPGGSYSFLQASKQQRYNTLRYAMAVLQVMTPEEFKIFRDRIDQAIQKQSSKNLFE